MKNKLLLVLLLVSAAWILGGCGSDTTTNPTNNNQSSGTTATITSSQAGNIAYENFKMVFPVGTVPQQANGSDGTVIFSMNTSSSMPTGLPTFPPGFTSIGNFLQAGPDLFVFNNTIRIAIPAGSQSPSSGLCVLGYIAENNAWKILPSVMGTDSASGGHYLYVDVLKLGYFVLANNSNALNPQLTPCGGVQWCVFNDYFFYLTVASASLSDPAYGQLYANGLVGRTVISPNVPGMPFPSDYCRGIFPLGTYTFWVSTRHWSSNDITTYSIPVPVTIANSLNWPLQWIPSAADGWTIFGCQLPAGGTWLPGRPQNWPAASVPYGSGTIQATLTWTNTNGTEADMDLHLYGPNNLHIYYASPTSTNFALDRDWQMADGDATENIYSTTTTVPAGNYRVNVDHYGGASKTFNCRVVVNGSVTNYSNTLSAGSVDVRSFTIQ